MLKERKYRTQTTVGIGTSHFGDYHTWNVNLECKDDTYSATEDRHA